MSSKLRKEDDFLKNDIYCQDFFLFIAWSRKIRRLPLLIFRFCLWWEEKTLFWPLQWYGLCSQLLNLFSYWICVSLLHLQCKVKFSPCLINLNYQSNMLMTTKSRNRIFIWHWLHWSFLPKGGYAKLYHQCFKMWRSCSLGLNDSSTLSCSHCGGF